VANLLRKLGEPAGSQVFINSIGTICYNLYFFCIDGEGPIKDLLYINKYLLSSLTNPVGVIRSIDLVK
jgi:hypothetical protein